MLLGACAGLCAPPAAALPTYEVTVTVTNGGGVALTDHQVSITLDTATLIAAGKLQADGDDLRVTDANGNALCYFLQGPLDNASTIVWVKIPSLAAGGSTTLYLYYGDASASSTANPSCTFDYWEGFDDAITDFSVACGDVVWSISGGALFLNWSTKGMFIASPTFPLTPILIAEADVLSTSGRWPGLHWFKSTSQYSYALTFGSSSVRISATPATTTDGDRCASHNWASSVISVVNSNGIWNLTWPAEGTQEGTFPAVGAISATNSEHLRDSPLQLGLGGIATGAGGMSVNWIRTRRYAVVQPTASNGSEHLACGVNPGLCNDADACTADACIAGVGCTHSPLVCNDASVCTTDTCNTATGCVYTPISCDDNNVCTVETCGATTGCAHTQTSCDDANACTIDTCNAITGCAHATILCDDVSLCTTDSCNTATGCVFTPISCDDSDACTADTCSAATGCGHSAISCDDASVCTIDSCNPASGCAHSTIDCDDHDACTAESCDALTGCGHTTISCDDGNACTIDSCDLVHGCQHTALDCNDGSACTSDTCDPQTGCVITAVDCDDHDACSTDTCNPASGCGHTAVVCEDYDACTNEVCDHTLGCVYTVPPCDDGDVCTSNTCDPAVGCVFPSISCEDGDRCTDDACVTPLGCQHYPTSAATFPTVICQIDWLADDVRAIKADHGAQAWYGRRVRKARIAIDATLAHIQLGQRAGARRRLNAMRTLLHHFLERTNRLRSRGRLREPDASALNERAVALLANVESLIETF